MSAMTVPSVSSHLSFEFESRRGNERLRQTKSRAAAAVRRKLCSRLAHERRNRADANIIYDALDAYMAELEPGLVELDVLADLFSGEENNRPQVTQFVGLDGRGSISSGSRPAKVFAGSPVGIE